MRKRIVVGLIVVINSLFLCSCGTFINPENYKHNKEVKEKQSEVSEQVIEAIFSHDKESLYDLFSQINKDNCNLEEQIEIMFNNFPVTDIDVSSMEKRVNGGGTSYEDGRIIMYSFGYKCEHIIDSKGQEYIISFGYTVEDEKKPDLIGLESVLVELVERNDTSNLNNYEIVEEYTVGDLSLY